jgi:hypothetical protein
VLELLAAIQSADPPSLVLWGLFVFAAGMYPVGFMLGSTCSPCCNSNPCTACTTGSLPDTVTVTFNGFTDKTPGPDLISLSFSSCFGGGASARVTAPGGDPDTDKGPISAVSLTNAGSGYAKLGRVAPTISIGGGSGTGATFTPTITSSNDACGVPSWKIASVAVKDGTGYVDGEALTVTIADGDIEAAAASVIVNTARTQPTLTASASPGSGAVFSVTMSQNFGSPSTWGVASVTVTNGGTGYTDGDNLTFAGGSATKVNEEASAYIRTGRSIPTLIGSVDGTGSSAAVTPTLTEYTDYYGGSYWSVTGFTITNGGSGYSENDPVSVTVTDGTPGYFSYFYAYVSSVDEDGAITGIAIDWGGEFYKDTGVIQSVELWRGGSYYDDDGVPTGVTVSGGGQYYREDASEPPYVATVTISISQTTPSDGTGAEITATVGDDPQNAATFGKITGLTIENGGTGYLAWKWVANACCGWQLNGMPIVLKRGRAGTISGGPIFPGSECVYSHEICGGWYTAPWGGRSTGAMQIRVLYGGPSVAPYVVIGGFGSSSENTAGPACGVTLQSQTLVSDCSSMSFTATPVSGPVGVTATVTSGGDYDENFKGKHGSASVPYTRCTQCCQGADDIPQEVEVYIEQDRYGDSSLSGTYVLPLYGFGGFGGQNWGFSICLNGSCASRFNVGIFIASGRCQSSEPEDCDNCVKKCEISASCSLSSHPSTWYDPPDDDLRNCPNYDSTITEEQRAALLCQAYCYDVPLCAPPQGMEFSFFDPNGSEGFSQYGYDRACEPNDDPTWQAGDPWEGPYTGPPLPNHLNTFKMTVQ